MTFTQPAIEPNDPSTWPPQVREFAESWADKLRHTSGTSVALLEQEVHLLELVGSHPVRAFHCTRLLDAEARSIRASGLAMLTQDLVEMKLKAAFACGALTDQELGYLLETHTYALGRSDGREDKICVLIGRSMLDHDDGLDLLLGVWGGEAIHFAHESTAIADRLKQLGRPSVVVLHLDLSKPERQETLFFPPLGDILVGTLLGWSGRESAGEAHIPGGALAGEIVDIWQPGHPHFDRYAQLAPHASGTIT